MPPRSKNPRKRSAPPIRIAKLLAHAGVASRRAAETLIREGKVRVDGLVISELGLKVDPQHAKIEVDGRPIKLSTDSCYLLLHKPRGTVCTQNDPEGRQRVYDLLPKGRRLWSVGRLDFQTSGALLLCDDGALTAALCHPRNAVKRIYDIKLRAELSPHAEDALALGIDAPDGGPPFEPVKPKLLSGERHAWWYRVVLHEGRNREVRRMFEHVGAKIQKLHRVAFANMTLDGIAPARYRFLEEPDVRALYSLVGLPWPKGHTVAAPPPVAERRRRSAKTGAARAAGGVKASASRDKRGGRSSRGGSGTGSRTRRPTAPRGR